MEVEKWRSMDGGGGDGDGGDGGGENGGGGDVGRIRWGWRKWR